jgi:hypothetical protein
VPLLQISRKLREDCGKLRAKVGDAVYIDVTILGSEMLGFLDSGPSHVFVNTTGCDRLLALGLRLKATPVNSYSLADDTLVECLGVISSYTWKF